MRPSANRLHLVPMLLLAVFLFFGMTSTSFANKGDRVNIIPNASHGFVGSATFSPDGRFVASSSYGAIKLWDIATGRLLRDFAGSYRTYAFSSDSRRLLFGSNNVAELRSTETGDLIRKFSNHSPGGVLLFNGSQARLLSDGIQHLDRLWSEPVEQLFQKIATDHDTMHGTVDAGMTWAISPDSKYFVLGTSSFGSRERDAARLWDVNSQRLLHVMPHPASVFAVAFSPDGSHLLTGTESKDRTVRLWDIPSGRLLRVFRGYKGRIKALRFSPDGKSFISDDYDGVKLWDVATGRLLGRFEGGKPIAFSPDGTWVLTKLGSSNQLAVWDARTAQIVRKLGNSSGYGGVKSVAYSEDGFHVYSIYASDQSVVFWDAKAGDISRLIEDRPEGRFIAISPDGRRAIITKEHRNNALIVLDLESERVASTLKGHRSVAPFAVFSKDAMSIFSSSEEEVRRWDARSGKLIQAIKKGVERGHDVFSFVDLSDDRVYVLWSGKYQSANVTDVMTGRRKRLKDCCVYAGQFIGRGGRYAVLGGQPTFMRVRQANGSKYYGGLTLWDVTAGRSVKTYDHGSASVLALAVSPDESMVATAGSDHLIRLWNITSGRLIQTFTGHLEGVKSVAFSPDGRRIVSGSDDNTIRIWRTSTGELLATLIKSSNHEWLAVTPEGFFAASERGAELLSVVRGFEVWSIDQFYQSLYRPDLVREKLGGDLRGLVREAAARLDLDKALASGNAPAVRVIAPLDGEEVNREQVRTEITVTDQGGGIGRIEWRVNGVVVGVEDRNVPTAPNAAPIRIARDIAVQEGDNEIDVVVYNQQNLIASIPARVRITARPTIAIAPPRVHVLAVGLNDYAEKDLRLAHAVADAQALAVAFPKSGRALYDKADAIILRDADVKRPRLDAAFNELATKMKPQDIFVFYIAGHGKTLDGRYYFIPQDFRFDGVQSVIQQGIKQEQWQRWFAMIPARKSLLLFDTCESGSLTGGALETRALERTAAHGRLAESTGRTIITASTDTGQAYEGFRGHGLFAYNLLDALQSSDADSSGTIEISELAAFTYAQVVELSKQVFKVKQVPQVQITGVNYAVGRPTPVFEATEAALKISSAPTHVVTRGVESQVRPLARGISVRNLDPSARVTVVKSEQGWALVAQNGKPIGYVPLASIEPIHAREGRPN